MKNTSFRFHSCPHSPQAHFQTNLHIFYAQSTLKVVCRSENTSRRCNNNPTHQITTIKMTESLTPWQYQPQNTERPLSPKRIPRQPPVFHRYNSQGGRIRMKTSQKSRVVTRDVIKLQERAPTQSVAPPEWQVEVKAIGFLKNELVIKIPNQYVTLPYKKADAAKKTSKSLSRRGDQGIIREKVSFRNFKREIQELDRLRSSNISKFCMGRQNKLDARRGSSSKLSIKTFKRCSLQNMNPFDPQPPTFPPKMSSLKPKFHQAETTKKHILDHLLSKFQ